VNGRGAPALSQDEAGLLSAGLQETFHLLLLIYKYSIRSLCKQAFPEIKVRKKGEKQRGEGI